MFGCIRDRIQFFVINDVVWDALDSLAEQLSDADDESREQAEMIVTIASGVTLSLSAGFVSWMMRAGSLVTSLLSATPIWRGFDPLPVIAARRDDEEDDEDPDTIADLFGAG